MSAKTSTNNAEHLVSAAELMPKNKMATQTLRERATHLSFHELDKKEMADSIPYIKFRLGAKEYYGIAYEDTKEVMQHITPTPVPFVPHFIAGVINRRGALLPVFDLKKLFHIQASNSNSTYIILTNYGGLTVGFLADSIEGSDFYNPSALDPALTAEEMIKSDYIVGLHQGITAIINVETILSDSQLQIIK